MCVLQGGFTALHIASHLPMVQTLLDAGADMGAQTKVSGSGYMQISFSVTSSIHVAIVLVMHG